MDIVTDYGGGGGHSRLLQPNGRDSFTGFQEEFCLILILNKRSEKNLKNLRVAIVGWM